MTKTERQRQARAWRKAQGYCHFGNHPADPGMGSCEPCRVKYGKRKAPSHTVEHPPRHCLKLTTQPRECLRCQRAFESWGAANRRCPRCTRLLQESESGPNSRRLPRMFREVVGG